MNTFVFPLKSVWLGTKRLTIFKIYLEVFSHYCINYYGFDLEISWLANDCIALLVK